MTHRGPFQPLPFCDSMAAQRVLLLAGSSTSGPTSLCTSPENLFRGPFLLEHSERLGSTWGLQWAAGAAEGSRGSRGHVGEGSSLREEPTMLGPPDLAGNRLLFPSAFKFIFQSDRSTNSLVPKVSFHSRKRLEVKLEAMTLKAWLLGLASGMQRHLGFSGVPMAWGE